jgi:Tol biopolymer transport system component
MLPAGGGEPQQVTTDRGVDAGPRWKPDGSGLVFYSTRTGHRELWTMAVGGGLAHQITRAEEESYFPAWSPDGREIAFEGGGIAVVPAGGGPWRRLTANPPDIHPDWSPDGQWIAFDSLRGGAQQVWRAPADGGQVERLAETPGTLPRWSPDGREVFFFGLGSAVNNVWAVSIASRKVRAVTAFTGRRGAMGLLGLAIDPRYLYFTWEEGRGDIWVAEIGQPPPE